MSPPERAVGGSGSGERGPLGFRQRCKMHAAHDRRAELSLIEAARAAPGIAQLLVKDVLYVQ